jgi:hypothetical protein
MEKISDSDRKILLSSPYVEKITESHVVFTVKFKILAVQKYFEGKSPNNIFTELGIETSIFLPDFPKKSIYRWKTIFLDKGVDGFTEENRGKSSPGRPSVQKFKSLEEEVAYLREENAVLKKLHALAKEYQKKNGSL